jgi:hypothetical protein
MVVFEAPDKGIPHDLLDSAKCIATKECSTYGENANGTRFLPAEFTVPASAKTLLHAIHEYAG